MAPSENIVASLCKRGPDFLGSVMHSVGGSGDRFLSFTSTVLALRGDHVTKQPLQNSGSYLCWNGEAWRINGKRVRGNDGEAILELLGKASASPTNPLEAVLGVFRSIEGPFAFVYYDAHALSLFFGRDRLGRRSLMSAQGDVTGELALCSLSQSCDLCWREVEADGIYVVDCSQPQTHRTRHDWLVGDHADFVSTRPLLGQPVYRSR